MNSADVVLVQGASGGGVGSAVVQLAKRRGGAHVIAITSSAKQKDVASLGADRVLTHEEVASGLLPENSIDVVVDNVAGVDLARS